MTTTDFFRYFGWGLLSVLAFVSILFIVYLMAKLVSYGWFSGQHRFEQDKLKKERDRGSSRR